MTTAALVVGGRARELERRVEAGVAALRTAWVETAAALYEFDSEEAWRELGFPSFSAWLSGRGVGISRSYAYSLIRTYRVFVVEGGHTPEELAGLDSRRFDLVAARVVKGELDSATALKQVESTPRIRHDTSSAFDDLTREVARRAEAISDPSHEIRAAVSGLVTATGDRRDVALQLAAAALRLAVSA